MGHDLVVDATAAQAGATALRQAADRVPAVGAPLQRAVAGAPGTELARALDELGAWAHRVDQLCAQVAEHAACARASALALVAADRELGR